MFLQVGRGQGIQMKGSNMWGEVREYKGKVPTGGVRSGSTKDSFLHAGRGQRVQRTGSFRLTSSQRIASTDFFEEVRRHIQQVDTGGKEVKSPFLHH